MASKRKQEQDPLKAALKVAEEIIDSASNVLGETFEAVSKLNEPLLKVEADIVEQVSPTAAEFLRPRRGKKNAQSSDDKTKKSKASKASKKDSNQTSQRKTKASKNTKKANTRSKGTEDKNG